MGRKQASGNQVLFFTRLMFTANRLQRLDGTSCREWIRLIHSVVKSTKIINGLVGVWGYVGSVRLRVLIMTEPSGTAASYQTASLPTFAPVGPRPRWRTLRWPPPPLQNSRAEVHRKHRYCRRYWNVSELRARLGVSIGLSPKIGLKCKSRSPCRPIQQPPLALFQGNALSTVPSFTFVLRYRFNLRFDYRPNGS